MYVETGETDRQSEGARGCRSEERGSRGECRTPWENGNCDCDNGSAVRICAWAVCKHARRRLQGKLLEIDSRHVLLLAENQAVCKHLPRKCIHVIRLKTVRIQLEIWNVVQWTCAQRPVPASLQIRPIESNDEAQKKSRSTQQQYAQCANEKRK